MRLVFEPSTSHRICLDSIGLVDYWRRGFIAGPETPPDENVVGWISPYQWHGQGLRWTTTWDKGGSQTAYLYNSLTSGLYERTSGPLSGLSSTVLSRGERLNETCIGERLSFGLPHGLDLAIGTEGRLVLMRSWRRVTHTPADPEAPDSEATYADRTWEANAYASARYARETVEVAAGIRGDYFALFDQLAPSVRGEVVLRPAAGLALTLSGGLYPGSVSYLVYQSERRAGQTGGETSERTSIQENVSRSIYGGLRAEYAPSPKLLLAAETYVNSMSGLSGYDLQYSALGGREEEIRDDAERGLACGLETEAQLRPNEALLLQVGYQLGRAQYYFADGGWCPANFDVTHVLRAGCS